MISALTAGSNETNCLDNFCGFNATGATFHASKASKAFINGRRIDELFDLTLLYHIYKLMRMIFHLFVRRTSAGAFAASHTLENVNTAGAKDLFFVVIVHLLPPYFTPSASARSSVK
jgi:hypothetical protein